MTNAGEAKHGQTSKQASKHACKSTSGGSIRDDKASQGGWDEKANLEKKLCDARKAITGIETHICQSMPVKQSRQGLAGDVT